MTIVVTLCSLNYFSCALMTYLQRWVLWYSFAGGVLKRRGHTEAALDLTELAGLPPAGVLCEIVNDEDGSMARLPYLKKFAKQHGFPLISIDALVKYCLFLQGCPLHFSCQTLSVSF